MHRLSTSMSRGLRVSGARYFAKKAPPMPPMTDLRNLNQESSTSKPKAAKKKVRTDHLNWTPRMLMVTLSGANQPSVPYRLLRVVDKYDGSVQSNRMTTLGCTFNASMLTAIPDFHNPKDFEADVREEFPDFFTGVQETQAAPLFGPSLIYLYLNLEGADGGAIMTRVLDILDRYEVTVKDVVTDVHQAPFTGYRINSSKILIGCHSQMDFDGFQTEMGDFQSETGFDVTMVPASEKDAKMAEELKQSNEGEQEEDEEEQRRSVDARYTDVTR